MLAFSWIQRHLLLSDAILWPLVGGMEHFPADVTGFDILARAALRHAIHFGSNSIALITVTITFASGQLPIAGTRMVNHWENLLYKPAVFIYYSR